MKGEKLLAVLVAALLTANSAGLYAGALGLELPETVEEVVEVAPAVEEAEKPEAVVLENNAVLEETAVAEINGTQYETLQAALSAAKTGETVKLVNDIAISLSDMYDEGTSGGIHYYRYARLSKTIPVNVTLDLNGHNIGLKDDAANTTETVCYRIFYLNYGSTLNVIGEGNININAADNVSGFVFVTNNTGGAVTLNLNINGTVYGNPCVVKNYGSNTINVLGGTYGISQRASTGTANNYPQAMFNSQSAGNKSIQIKGGTLIGADPKSMDDGNLLAPGYAANAVDGKYTVAKKTSGAASVTVDGEELFFDTLQAAIDAVPVQSAENTANYTIKLCQDIVVTLPEENVTSNTRYYFAVINNKNITLDFDGHSITWDEARNNTASNVYFAIYNNANVTVTGNGSIIGADAGNTYAFWLRSEEAAKNYQPSKLTIESSNIESDCAVYTNDNNGNRGGEVVINGGKFEYTNESGSGWAYKQLINVYGNTMIDNKRITIKGGSYVNCDPRYFQDNWGTVVNGAANSLMVDSNTYSVEKKTVSGKTVFTVIPNTDVVAAVETTYSSSLNTYCGMDMWGTLSGKKITYGYTSLADAVANAAAGDTITLLSDVSAQGLVIEKSITLDLGGHTYTIENPTVGSAGTQTNGFQLKASTTGDNSITIKNGTITSTKAKILIQNYRDLTLDGVTLDGTSLNTDGNPKPYTLSNNNGNVLIKDNCTIKAHSNGFAFDVYNWMESYPNGITVTVEQNADIQGKVEIANDNTSDPMNSKLVYCGNEYSAPGSYLQNKAAGTFEKQAAERSIDVYASAASVEAEDTVTITVKVDGEKIGGANYTLKYNPAYFSLEDTQASTIFTRAEPITNTTAGTIEEMLYLPTASGAVTENPITLVTYTFKAIAQTTDVTASFEIIDPSAPSMGEAILPTPVPDTTTNSPAQVQITLKDMGDYNILVDGTAITDEQKTAKAASVVYTGNAHTFALEALPTGGASVAYVTKLGEDTVTEIKAEGVYTITYTITPETGYRELVETFTLTVTKPEFDVEVVADDYVLGNADLGIKAKKLVLVLANTTLGFKYDGFVMVDVTDRYSTYYPTYGKIYGYVTDAIDAATDDTYKAKVTYSKDTVNKTIDQTLDQHDLNLDSDLDVRDIIVAYGAYNGEPTYFNDLYQANILKADVNCNKKIDNADPASVVDAVRSARTGNN